MVLFLASSLVFVERVNGFADWIAFDEVSVVVGGLLCDTWIPLTMVLFLKDNRVAPVKLAAAVDGDTASAELSLHKEEFRGIVLSMNTFPLSLRTSLVNFWSDGFILLVGETGEPLVGYEGWASRVYRSSLLIV